MCSSFQFFVLCAVVCITVDSFLVLTDSAKIEGVCNDVVELQYKGDIFDHEIVNGTHIHIIQWLLLFV